MCANSHSCAAISIGLGGRDPVLGLGDACQLAGKTGEILEALRSGIAQMFLEPTNERVIRVFGRLEPGPSEVSRTRSRMSDGAIRDSARSVKRVPHPPRHRRRLAGRRRM